MSRGDIVAVVGLKNTTTGDTLCDAAHPICSSAWSSPSRSSRGDRAQDEGRPGEARQGARHALRGGPDLPGPHRRGDRPDDHRRHGRAAPRGARRPHAARVPVEPNVGKPQVAYRETITSPRRSRSATSARPAVGPVRPGRHQLEPTGPGGGYEFVDKSAAAASPGSTSPRSTPASRRRWPAACSPAIRSSTSGRADQRQVPRRGLLRDGVQDRRVHGASRRPPGGPSLLLEPIMEVEVVTPEDYMGDVMGDLSPAAAASRAWSSVERQVVRAQVPLSEMFGYATDLRSRTQGRATYTMQFDSYQQMPDRASGRSSPGSVASSPTGRHERLQQIHGQREVRAEQASCECGDDGSY